MSLLPQLNIPFPFSMNMIFSINIATNVHSIGTHWMANKENKRNPKRKHKLYIDIKKVLCWLSATEHDSLGSGFGIGSVKRYELCTEHVELWNINPKPKFKKINIHTRVCA